MRWAPDARGRLERAALELFSAQGFDATTVPEIARRAGLTTRSFFRHFADKREVIFAGDEIPEFARAYLTQASQDLGPLEVVIHGLRHVAQTRFEDRRNQVEKVRALIAANDSLRERDARKRADLVEVIDDALRGRGSSPTQARVLAETTVMILHLTLDAWLDGPPDRSMTDVLDEQWDALRDVLTVPSS
jgi:AcrR family transcriptional regulator